MFVLKLILIEFSACYWYICMKFHLAISKVLDVILRFCSHIAVARW